LCSPVCLLALPSSSRSLLTRSLPLLSPLHSLSSASLLSSCLGKIEVIILNSVVNVLRLVMPR